MRPCSFATCANPAQSALRLIPRRTETPACDEIRKALVWPNVELATSVYACGFHREAFRKASQVVMAESPLNDEAVVRVVKD